VTTQIKLPLYHKPRSPLGLVVVEIIFGRLFEAFRHASYGVGAGAGTLVGGTAQPMKKTREVPLKSVLVPRKLIIFYLLLYTNSHSGDITYCRNPFKDGSSKSACQPPLTTPSVLPVSTTPVPPPSGGTSLAIRSTAEALDSVRCLVEYLEGLMKAEADREGTHFSFVISSLRSFLLVP
jgi:hypothetical protein